MSLLQFCTLISPVVSMIRSMDVPETMANELVVPALMGAANDLVDPPDVFMNRHRTHQIHIIMSLDHSQEKYHILSEC